MLDTFWEAGKNTSPDQHMKHADTLPRRCSLELHLAGDHSVSQASIDRVLSPVSAPRRSSPPGRTSVRVTELSISTNQIIQNHSPRLSIGVLCHQCTRSHDFPTRLVQARLASFRSSHRFRISDWIRGSS